MTAPKDQKPNRLCLHTITTKPWSLEKAVTKYQKAGIQGISVWRHYLEGHDLAECDRKIKKAGLECVALVRGGFFTGLKPEDRKKAIEENKKVIDEAAGIGAGMVVLVCGATPGQSLDTSRNQIREAIGTLLPYAEEQEVKLVVEPLHPMYADTRSAINTLEQANDLTEYFGSDWVGVALDVYHLWWDPDLKNQIMRCGENKNLYAVHLCDWRVPVRNILNDREIMGKGIIDLSSIIQWVKEAGYKGFYEVEIFSDHYWGMDQDRYLQQIIDAYLKYDI